MPNLYQNYCYADLATAANAELSSPTLVSDLGLVSPKAFTSTSLTSGLLMYHYTPLNGGAAYDLNHDRIYPACSSVGYLTNFSGLELVDVVEISFSVILVWAVAFGYKSMRRPIR